MEDKIKLSLKEETEKETASIEAEVLNNAEIKNVEVSSEMEARLLEKIKEYESHTNNETT